MRKDIERYELIERYLKNQLSGSELQDFKNLMNSDSKLYNEVQQQKLVHRYISESSLVNLKSEIESIHKKQAKSGFLKNRLNLFWSVPVILLVAALFVFIPKNNNDIELEEHALVSSDSSKKEIEIVKKIETEYTKSSSEEPTIKTSRLTEEIIKETKSDEPVKQVEVDTVVESKRSLDTLFSQKDYPDTVAENQIQEEELPVLVSINTDTSKTPSFDCSSTYIYAEVLVEESCSEKPSGLLQVLKSSISGGTPPYQTAIDTNNFIQEFVFNGLKSANYNVFVKDANNCISEIGSYYIDEKDCTYEVAFAPLKGETWPIPEQSSLSLLTIFDKSGRIVFSTELIPGIQLEWDGRNNSGSELPTGVYLFEIKADRTILLWGNVTIVR